ncbi:MAG: type II secretion system F family protein [Rhodovulum sp.]|nr:type II secretion system F family protein [Rhodovulum sp.]
MADLVADNMDLLITLFVFVAAAAATFGIRAMVRVRGAVRRRAAGIVGGGDLDDGAGGRRSFRQASVEAVQRLIDYTTRHYASFDDGSMKLLRQRLVQAGIFDPRAVGFFFLVRGVLAAGLGIAAFGVLPLVSTLSDSTVWALVGVAGLAGYLGPSLALDRIVKKRRDEYRTGFPDFMDLLVVCADAGLGMEGSLERIGRELASSYPALAQNIHITNLEIRAGRTLTEALEHFGDRLGLEEVRSFATLIQQSDELGSSITDALRVYSEDMRHKRLSLAEEKAYSLPVKLSVPLMVCVFPVLFVVILLPVFVRVKLGAY